MRVGTLANQSGSTEIANLMWHILGSDLCEPIEWIPENVWNTHPTNILLSVHQSDSVDTILTPWVISEQRMALLGRRHYDNLEWFRRMRIL